MVRVEKIKDCIDFMAGFELLVSTKEKKEVLQSVIDRLCGYPKPQHKGDTVKAAKNDIVAYLFVSNVRNTCKLAEMQLIPYETAAQIIGFNLVNALNVLFPISNN